MPEPYYVPTGHEAQPKPVGEECGIIVYQYYPISAVNYVRHQIYIVYGHSSCNHMFLLTIPNHFFIVYQKFPLKQFWKVFGLDTTTKQMKPGIKPKIVYKF